MQHSIVRRRTSPNPNEARVSCEEEPKTVGHFPRLHVASSSLHCTAPPHHRRTAGVRAKTRRHKTPPSPRSLTLFLSSTLNLPSAHRMGVLASYRYPSGLCDLVRSPGPLIRSVPKDCWTLLRRTNERGAFPRVLMTWNHRGGAPQPCGGSQCGQRVAGSESLHGDSIPWSYPSAERLGAGDLSEQV